MGRSADLIGQPIPFSFEGQPYPLAPCTCEVELAFTNWLEMRARDKIVRRKKQLQETGDYEAHLRIWQQGVDAARYDFAGGIAWESRCNEPGQKELLWMLMVKVTPAVTRSLVDRIFADPEKRRELFQLEDKEQGTTDGPYWRALAQGRPTVPEPKTSTPE